MKKLNLLLLCLILAFSSCVKDKYPARVVIDPIEIPEESRSVTLPNELEEGVLSVGLYVEKSFTVGESWSVDPTTVPDWCSVVPMSGEKGDVKVKFIVKKENGNWAANTANVIIKPNSGVSGTVAVTQPGISEGTIYVPTAGDLTSLLATVANKSTLKIVGTLNAADFAAIKGIATLENLDLMWAHLPSNEIPEDAFHVNGVDNTTLKTIVLPNNLTSIGEAAFANCLGLTTMPTLPAGVTTIKEYAFYGCYNMAGALTVPSTVTSIGKFAFSQCNGLTGDLTIPAGVALGEGAFQQSTGFDGTLTISSGVTIGTSAFSGCQKFTTLVLKEGVTAIGDAAFGNCSALAGTLTIPSTVTSIGDAAFQNCIKFTGNLLIPVNVTNIGESAFEYCTGLNGTLTLPAGLTAINKAAFNQCSALTGTLTIPTTVTSIGASAFNNCKLLTGTLTIPAVVTSIGANAFSDCIGFAGTLVIPALVTSIGEAAFLRTGMSDVKSLMPAPPTTLQASNIFGGTQMGLLDLIIPQNTTDAYINQGWGGFNMMSEEE